MKSAAAINFLNLANVRDEKMKPFRYFSQNLLPQLFALEVEAESNDG